jgi:AraC-like DNA-binding protein
MQRFGIMNLSEPPSRLLMGFGDLDETRQEWLQPVDRWMAHYYQHPNVVHIGSAVLPVLPDTVIIFPPGVRCGHSRYGNGTEHYRASFFLTGTSGSPLAVPLVNPSMGDLLASLQVALLRIIESPVAGSAWLWNFLWSQSLEKGVLRENEELYAAEEWILKHIAQNFSVPELAEVAGVSPRRLLRMFRSEHHMTVQEYVRNKRVQEATRLLSTTDRPIKEIARRIGMQDLQAFNKMIRAETGSSPTIFRSLRGAETATKLPL